MIIQTVLANCQSSIKYSVLKYKYKYKYPSLKYKYKYKYSDLKYKYKYKYPSLKYEYKYKYLIFTTSTHQVCNCRRKKH